MMHTARFMCLSLLYYCRIHYACSSVPSTALRTLRECRTAEAATGGPAHYDVTTTIPYADKRIHTAIDHPGSRFAADVRASLAHSVHIYPVIYTEFCVDVIRRTFVHRKHRHVVCAFADVESWCHGHTCMHHSRLCT